MNLILLFAKILDMSISAILIIVFVLLVRGAMNKLPKKYSYILWLIVGIRLVCPVVISLPFSLVYSDGLNPTIVTDYVQSDIRKENSESNENNNVSIKGMNQTKNEIDSENAGIMKSEAIEEIDSQSEVKNDQIENNNIKESNAKVINSESDKENQIIKNTDVKENVFSHVKQIFLSASEKILSAKNLKIFTIIWMAGILVVLIWNICLVLWTKGKLEMAVHDSENIYESDAISSPFVWGIIQPRIYIPFRMTSEEKDYILAHEKYHIKRKDYIVKLIAFLITAVYWFHPLVWLAYYCMVQDMEMSCDEQVILSMNEDIRSQYSELLLAFATNRRNLSPGMLTFGEKNTRKRIKHVLDFKKPMKWIGVVGILAIVLAAVLCLTNGSRDNSEEKQATNSNETEEYNEAIYGKIDRPDETITLTVHDELTSFNGIQEGWIADVLLEKFNVELNIVPGVNEQVIENEFSEGDKADIVIFALDSSYEKALKSGQLYNWEKNELLNTYGTYMNTYLSKNIASNKKLNTNYLASAKDLKVEAGIYGIKGGCTLSERDMAPCYYKWDMRWDLYKELDYPEIKNLDDLFEVLQDMQKLQPLDDNGKKAYATVLYSEYLDNSFLSGIHHMCAAYYGVIKKGDVFYNPETGKEYSLLEKNGPYLKVLEWYNKMYRAGLLDPESKELKYEDITDKLNNGSILFIPANYDNEYNSNPMHIEEGKFMAPVKPDEASPVIYQLSEQTLPLTYAIGADTKYPELAMAVLNYMTTPEGMLTIYYGKKGECWDYDEEGNTYLTELGQQLQSGEVSENEIPEYYMGGRLQFTNYILALGSSNPESAGDTFNAKEWKFNFANASEIEKDWQEKTGYDSPQEYLKKEKHTFISHEEFPTNGEVVEEGDSAKFRWINNYSLAAIYAESEEEFWDAIDRLRLCLKKLK